MWCGVVGLEYIQHMHDATLARKRGSCTGGVLTTACSEVVGIASPHPATCLPVSSYLFT